MHEIVAALHCLFVWSAIGTENDLPSAASQDHAETDMDVNDSQLLSNSDQQGDDYSIDRSNSMQLSPPNIEKWTCVKFLLRVAEDHHLTHEGVSNLSNSVQWLVDLLFSQLKEKIYSYLSESNLVSVDKDALLSMCESDDILSGLYSQYLREKFCTESFNYAVNKVIL